MDSKQCFCSQLHVIVFTYIFTYILLKQFDNKHFGGNGQEEDEPKEEQTKDARGAPYGHVF